MPGKSCSLVLLLALALPAAADEASAALCTLWRFQSEVSREELELDVELAGKRLVAAEEIHSLVDQLWEKDAIAEVLWLTARHDRDVAKIDVERRQLRLERKRAELDWLASICGAATGEKQRRTARARYLQVDCHRLGKDLAIAEIDLAYYTSLLESAHDLRAGDVATRQDVIRAERDVALAEERVERYGPRVEACIASGAAAGTGDTTR